MIGDPVIRHKKDFIERWKRGDFGNRLRTWDSLEEFLASGTTDCLVGYRSRVSSSKRCRTHFKPEEIEEAVRQEIARGAGADELYIGESPDDSTLRLQGEFYYGLSGPSLFYDTTPGLNMRTAMLRGRQTYGVTAMQLLRYHMDGSSFDDMMELTNTYPNAVVEFSVYGHKLGNCGRNTIIWDVRDF